MSASRGQSGSGSGSGSVSSSDFVSHRSSSVSSNSISSPHSFSSTSVLRSGVADPLSFHNPRYDFVESSAPSISFGKSERFLSNRIQFISRHHNQDALCTHSPGPVYRVVDTSVTSRRPPNWSWGEKPTAEQILRKKRYALTTDDIGPAAYSPNITLAKPAAPRASFPKADRFNSSAGIYRLNNSPIDSNHDSSILSEPKITQTTRAAPAYSFGPRNLDGTNRPNGRSAIFNQSIRGGFSRSATFESGVGPADYNPFDSLRPGSSRWSFGSAPRFLRPGLQFVSAQHAQCQVGVGTPGSKYIIQNFDMARKNQTRGAEMKWMP